MNAPDNAPEVRMFPLDLLKKWRAIEYARRVREARNWPPAQEWLCPWLYESSKEYWMKRLKEIK